MVIFLNTIILNVSGQKICNGFKISREFHGELMYEDLKLNEYKGDAIDKKGNLILISNAEIKDLRKLKQIEKSIFEICETKKVQNLGKRKALAQLLIDAVTGDIVSVSFWFKTTDQSFKMIIIYPTINI